MKYIWMAVAGFVVGGAAGAALLLVNPLIASSDEQPAGFDRVFEYRLPADAVALTHGGLSPLRRMPVDIETLWESTIRSTSFGTLVLTGASGEPEAVASRISIPSKRTELLTQGLLVDDYWLLSVPGEGMLFVIGESNLSSIAKDTLVSVSLLGRSWEKPRSYVPTHGPELGETARVVGASGLFANEGGRALEQYRIERFSRDDGFENVSAELHVSMHASALPEE